MVSVIVPNYNHSRYLRQRIDSILNQTYQDFELILLDDKSTDNSVEVLQSYASDPHVSHVVVNDENSGCVFRQWERGLSLARGKYVWIAESDDYAEPTLIEKCVEVLESDSEIVVCQVGAHTVLEDGTERRNDYDRWDGEGDGRVNVYDGRKFINGYLKYYNYLYNASGIIFRRAGVLPLPEETKTMRVCGDWVVWLTMAERGKVAIVHSRLNNYRVGSASISRRSVPIDEDIRIFVRNADKGYFSRVWKHNYWCQAGHILRMIKHEDDADRKAMLYDEMAKVLGTRSRAAYHYSQFIKMLGYAMPFMHTKGRRKV